MSAASLQRVHQLEKRIKIIKRFRSRYLHNLHRVFSDKRKARWISEIERCDRALANIHDKLRRSWRERV